jgi:hypothetical protein
MDGAILSDKADKQAIHIFKLEYMIRITKTMEF